MQGTSFSFRLLFRMQGTGGGAAAGERSGAGAPRPAKRAQTAGCCGVVWRGKPCSDAAAHLPGPSPADRQPFMSTCVTTGCLLATSDALKLHPAGGHRPPASLPQQRTASQRSRDRRMEPPPDLRFMIRGTRCHRHLRRFQGRRRTCRQWRSRRSATSQTCVRRAAGASRALQHCQKLSWRA